MSDMGDVDDAGEDLPEGFTIEEPTGDDLRIELPEHDEGEHE